MFPTGSKTDVQELPYETLKDICAAVSIPVVAIGRHFSGECGQAGRAAASAVWRSSAPFTPQRISSPPQRS